ncbi:hypothetical protein BU14_0032s0027 [Porphyra umbilicalis]|uniref:Uncharacterized protein n=1 Tax=Porphyra umbilicalis TaxID=2786 RepID=A0A1X6PIR6_PORUM|nr:hypothetical protein BU14_0032s0027 [Porphyra umbilicalis]|eukprot:OSX80769.1 hypothetical protein BU14_0032s0027 [Porphyra umbilicalis]
MRDVRSRRRKSTLLTSPRFLVPYVHVRQQGVRRVRQQRALCRSVTAARTVSVVASPIWRKGG